MKKELLIFGSNGALGKGIVNVMINKNYDSIYLFDHRRNTVTGENQTITNLQVDDLSIEANVKEAFKNILPSKDKIYFLYTTVGGYSGGEYLWGTSFEDWSRMFNINLSSSFLIAKHFSNLVKESAGGSICFTSAYTGIIPQKKSSAYGISKAGIIHLVKSLAAEGDMIKLSVNAIAPFIIDTENNREWGKESDFKSWVKPEEIGELAHSIFCNFNFISGNIFQLKHRFNISS